MTHESPYAFSPEPSSWSGERESTVPSLDQEVANLLSSEQISQLPIEQQGEVIADGFIGMLTRRGTVEGNVDMYDTSYVLKLADGVRRRDDMRNFTRKDGLRAAVDALAADERTSRLFGQLSKRVTVDNNRQVTLTTEGQLVAYIESGDNHIKDPNGQQIYGTDWINTLLERAVGDAGWIDNPNRGLIESDNDYLRQQGLKWRNAVDMARRAGMDVDLLARSAKYIEANKQQ